MRVVPRSPAREGLGSGPQGHAENAADRREIVEHEFVPFVVEAGLAIPGAGGLLRRVRQLLDGVDEGLDGAGHGQHASGYAPQRARTDRSGRVMAALRLRGDVADRGTLAPPALPSPGREPALPPDGARRGEEG